MVMWTLSAPAPVTLYLDMWGGESHTSLGLKRWLLAPDSKWVLQPGFKGAQHNGGPGQVYAAEYPAGPINIFGSGETATNGQGVFLLFVEPKVCIVRLLVGGRACGRAGVWACGRAGVRACTREGWF